MRTAHLGKICRHAGTREAFAVDKQIKAARIMAAVRQESRNAQRSGDYRGMMKTLDAAIEEMPEDTGLQMMKFQTMIGPMNDPEGYQIEVQTAQPGH